MMFVVEDDDDGLTHQVEYFKDRVKKPFPQPISSFRSKPSQRQKDNVAESRGKLRNGSSGDVVRGVRVTMSPSFFPHTPPPPPQKQVQNRMLEFENSQVKFEAS